MTHETPHPHTVIARLEKLERQHHHLKLAGLMGSLSWDSVIAAARNVP